MNFVRKNPPTKSSNTVVLFLSLNFTICCTILYFYRLPQQLVASLYRSLYLTATCGKFCAEILNNAVITGQEVMSEKI